MKRESLSHYLNRVYTPKSARCFICTLKHFLATNPQAKRYAYKDIVSYMDTLTAQYSNYNTLNGKLLAIKAYYDFLLETGQRSDHPCKYYHIKGYKRKPVQLQDLFSQPELELMLQQDISTPKLKLRNQLVYSLLIYQGLFAEEIVRLSVSDIDLDLGKIYIKRTRRSAQRSLALYPMQLRLLERYLDKDRKKLLREQPSDHLIVTISGNQEAVEGVAYLVKRMRGLFPDRRLNATSIRSSVISNWLNEDKLPLEQVQIMAGHKFPGTTERYKRVNIDEQKKQVNMFHPLA